MALKSEVLLPNPWQKLFHLMPQSEQSLSALVSLLNADCKKGIERIYPTSVECDLSFLYGNQVFWLGLKTYLDEVIAVIRHELPDEVSQDIQELQKDSIMSTTRPSFSQFVSAVVSQYLLYIQEDQPMIKIKSRSLDATQDDVLQNLGYLKDLAVKSDDPSLERCWATFRDMYVQRKGV